MIDKVTVSLPVHFEKPHVSTRSGNSSLRNGKGEIGLAGFLRILHADPPMSSVTWSAAKSNVSSEVDHGVAYTHGTNDLKHSVYGILFSESSEIKTHSFGRKKNFLFA